MNETEAMSLYKKCYEDAVSKNLPEWYLHWVYSDGKGDFDTLQQVSSANYKSVMDMLLVYFGWQHTENTLAILRGEGGNIYKTDKLFRELLTRI